MGMYFSKRGTATDPDIIKTEIRKWFDNACIQFKNLSAENVLSNDTQYDIDSLEQEFVKFHIELTGEKGTYTLFANEVSKRCKNDFVYRAQEYEEVYFY